LAWEGDDLVNKTPVDLGLTIGGDVGLEVVAATTEEEAQDAMNALNRSWFTERFTTPERAGAVGDGDGAGGGTDDRLALVDWFDGLDGQDAYLPPNKNYRIGATGSSTIFNFNSGKDNFRVNGRGGTLDLTGMGASKTVFAFTGSVSTSVGIVGSLAAGDTVINTVSSHGLAVGDIIEVNSNELYRTDSLFDLTNKRGQTVMVAEVIDANSVRVWPGIKQALAARSYTQAAGFGTISASGNVLTFSIGQSLAGGFPEAWWIGEVLTFSSGLHASDLNAPMVVTAVTTTTATVNRALTTQGATAVYAFTNSPFIAKRNHVENVSVEGIKFLLPRGDAQANNSVARFLYTRNCEFNRNIIRGNDTQAWRFENALDCRAMYNDVEFDMGGVIGSSIVYGGVFVNMAERCKMSHNSIIGGRHSIDFSESGTHGIGRDNEVSFNYLAGTYEGAIDMHSSQENNNIFGNLIEFSRNGIEILAPGNNVYDNVIRQLTDAYHVAPPQAPCGIVFTEQANNTNIERNVIDGCNYGILAAFTDTYPNRPSNIAIRGNKISNFATAGIQVIYENALELDMWDVSGNKFSDGGETAYPIYLQGKFRNIRVIDNHGKRIPAGTREFITLLPRFANTPIDVFVWGNTFEGYGNVNVSADAAGSIIVRDNYNTGFADKTIYMSQAATLAAGAVSHTGNTTETALQTVTILASRMGPNGWIEIEGSISTPGGTVGGKTARVRFNGIAGTIFYQVTVTTALSLPFRCVIRNINSASAQIGSAPISLTTGFGSSTTALPTGARVTTANTDLVITGQLADGADTIRIDGLTVKVFYAP
jgi:hypothetical protein